jgi:hypothetical protein
VVLALVIAPGMVAALTIGLDSIRSRRRSDLPGTV